MSVDAFINYSNWTWNVDTLNQYLQPQDVEQVLKIKLSRFAGEDKLIWPFTKDMQYTVRSGYWAATHCYLEGEEIMRPEGSVVLKQGVWKLDILPKIKQFLWRVLSGALPTYTTLCSRGVSVDPTCQRCCIDEESINHLLFLCPYASGVWRCSGLIDTRVFSVSLESNLQLLFDAMEAMPEFDVNALLPFWVVWFIWKSRNEFIFAKRNEHPSEDFRRAWDANVEWHSNVVRKGSRRSSVRPLSSKWEPPPKDWVKCNFDYSSVGHDSKAGISWIVRDDNGRYLGAGSTRIDTIQTSLEGEARSFLVALQQVWLRGWRRVWFEGDNLELCSIINKMQESLVLGNELSNIRFWMSLLPECSLDYVNRERNQAADVIARRANQQDDPYIFYNLPPVWLIKFLYAPYTI